MSYTLAEFDGLLVEVESGTSEKCTIGMIALAQVRAKAMRYEDIPAIGKVSA